MNFIKKILNKLPIVTRRDVELQNNTTNEINKKIENIVKLNQETYHETDVNFEVPNNMIPEGYIIKPQENGSTYVNLGNGVFVTVSSNCPKNVIKEYLDENLNKKPIDEIINYFKEMWNSKNIKGDYSKYYIKNNKYIGPKEYVIFKEFKSRYAENKIALKVFVPGCGDINFGEFKKNWEVCKKSKLIFEDTGRLIKPKNSNKVMSTHLNTVTETVSFNEFNKIYTQTLMNDIIQDVNDMKQSNKQFQEGLEQSIGWFEFYRYDPIEKNFYFMKNNRSKRGRPLELSMGSLLWIIEQLRCGLLLEDILQKAVKTSNMKYIKPSTVKTAILKYNKGLFDLSISWAYNNGVTKFKFNKEYYLYNSSFDMIYPNPNTEFV